MTALDHGRAVPKIAGLRSLSTHHTAKLELPSISQVHSRGPVDASWFQPHYTPRTTASGEALPALNQIQTQGPSSATSSPRGGSISNSSVYNGSLSSATSYTPSVNGQQGEFKTPSPQSTPYSSRDQPGVNGHHDSPYGHQQHQAPGFGFGADSYPSMNVAPYSDVHQQHMATTHAQPPASSALPHYSGYQPAPIMQSGPQPYPSPQSSYSQYPSYASMSAPPPGHSSSISSSLVPSIPQSLPALPSESYPPEFFETCN